jgi:hypothetical protein
MYEGVKVNISLRSMPLGVGRNTEFYFSESVQIAPEVTLNHRLLLLQFKLLMIVEYRRYSLEGVARAWQRLLRNELSMSVAISAEKIQNLKAVTKVQKAAA